MGAGSHRPLIAGLHLLAAPETTRREALRAAGYQNPNALGSPSGTACVQTALEALPQATGANILSLAREVACGDLRAAKALPDGKRLSASARILDSAERWYGEQGERNVGARTVIERVTYIKQLVVMAENRGLLGNSSTEAKAITTDNVNSLSPEQAQVVDCVEVTAPGRRIVTSRTLSPDSPSRAGSDSILDF